MWKIHFEEADEASVLLTFDFVELQDAIYGVSCRLEFIHRFLSV